MIDVGRKGSRGAGSTLPVLRGDPTLENDALALHRALGELVRVYQFRDRDRICCYDVSVTQCYALEAVVHDGPLTLNELAARMYLDKSTTSRVVDALQKKGYVDRQENPDDRRALRLEATPDWPGVVRAHRGRHPGPGEAVARRVRPGGEAVDGAADRPVSAGRGVARRYLGRHLLQHLAL